MFRLLKTARSGEKAISLYSPYVKMKHISLEVVAVTGNKVNGKERKRKESKEIDDVFIESEREISVRAEFSSPPSQRADEDATETAQEETARLRSQRNEMKENAIKEADRLKRKII